MKFLTFQQSMKKALFTWAEAKIVAYPTPPATLQQQLHQWVQRGNLIRLRRGLYAFAQITPDTTALAHILYTPAYFSLEYALHCHGLIPDVPFNFTLVTPKATRRFDTAWGTFLYHRIKSQVFYGFDPKTLLAKAEKAIVDYLYFYAAHLKTMKSMDGWQSLRWQNLHEINWDQVQNYVEVYKSPLLKRLALSLKEYTETHGSP